MKSREGRRREREITRKRERERERVKSDQVVEGGKKEKERDVKARKGEWRDSWGGRETERQRVHHQWYRARILPREST